MELPQSRPFGTESKKPTHDFLTMYSDSSLQHQDPRPSSQGFYPKTRDFLHPLERVSKSNGIISREGIPVSANVENPSSVEHLLPGGIGTYTISHVTNLERGTARPERSTSAVVQASNTERKIEPKRSNGCSSSYNGGAFTLWDETMEKEKIVMNDKAGGQLTREPAEKLGQWSSESPSSFIVRNGATSGGFSSISSSKQKQGGGHQKCQGLMEMMKSIKGLQDEEDDDEEEYMKREGSSQKGDMGGKVEGKGNDPRANTPRSKHSATEQRRRSKINDRFQILRELIPHSDQKRDKASFLLEVIEYIHFLQEKVTKYETAFPGWNQDSMKLMPWKHSQGTGECIPDHARVMKNGPGTGLMFPGKFDESSIPLSPAMLAATQNPMEPDNFGSGPIYKPMDHHHAALTSKGVSLPMQHQQNMYPSAVVRGNAGFAQPQRLVSDVENMAPQWQRPCPTGSDTLTEQEELTIEGGTVRMSSVYSHGLLSSLTHALQSSGIDLSQASISVQIDLGKRAIRPSTTTSSAKDHEDPSTSTRAMTHSRVASSGEDSDPAQKRLRMDNS